MKSTIFFILFMGTIGQMIAQNKSIANLPRDLNEAYSSMSMHDRQVLENIGADIYQLSRIQIKAIPGKEIIIGIDKDKDGKNDEFIGLQTNEDYKLKKSFKAEVIYFRNILIVRSIKGKKRAYFFKLSGLEKSEEILALIPDKYKAKARNYYGYGLRYHKGDYEFEDFIGD